MKRKRKKNANKKKQVKSVKFGVIGESVGLIISLLLLLYVFPRLSFVTTDYRLWLPVAIWTTIVSDTLKITKHLVENRILKHTFEMGSLLSASYSLYKLVEIYPVNLTVIGYSGVDPLVRFSLRIAVYALFLAIIVNFIQIFVPKKKGKKES